MINGFPKLKQYGDHSKDLGIKSANKSKIELIHLPYNRFRGNDTLWNETKPASGEILLPPAGSHSHPYSSNSFPFGATHLLCMTHTLYILGLTSHGNDNTCCKTKQLYKMKRYEFRWISQKDRDTSVNLQEFPCHSLTVGWTATAVMDWNHFLFIHHIPDCVCHHRVIACGVCYCHFFFLSDSDGGFPKYLVYRINLCFYFIIFFFFWNNKKRNWVVNICK